jgi:hypothetical protein
VSAVVGTSVGVSVGVCVCVSIGVRVSVGLGRKLPSQPLAQVFSAPLLNTKEVQPGVSQWSSHWPSLFGVSEQVSAVSHMQTQQAARALSGFDIQIVARARSVTATGVDRPSIIIFINLTRELSRQRYTALGRIQEPFFASDEGFARRGSNCSGDRSFAAAGATNRRCAARTFG